MDENKEVMNSEELKNMNHEELVKWMKSVEESNADQAKYAKKQFTMAMIGAIANVAVLVIVLVFALTFAPKINKTMGQVDTVMTDLESISSQLAQIDYAGTIESVNDLVGSSEESVSAAMQKINEMDIDSLNAAIKDLHAVVQPLANLFGRR